MMSLAHRKLGINVTVTDTWWNAIILAGWGLLIMVAVLSSTVPASVWMDVKDVFIADAPVGTQPEMKVDRIIKSDFVAMWLVEVERDYGSGFGLFCSANGENAYRSDAVPPTPLRLDWWTYPTKCVLPAGRYRVETTWRIDVPFVPEKFVRIMSNVFTMYEPSRTDRPLEPGPAPLLGVN